MLYPTMPPTYFFALHFALHGQALHRAATADVSAEALVVRAAAVDVDVGYGVSRAVEGAGVLRGGVPYRRPVVGAFGQGDVRRQGGVQLEVVPARVHEGGEEAELIGRAEEADGGVVGTRFPGRGEEVLQFGRPVCQRGQAGGGAGACLVVVGEAGFRIVDHDGDVHRLEVVRVQVLEGAGGRAVGGAALGAEHLVVGGVATVEGAGVVVSHDAAGVAAGSVHRACAGAGDEGAVVVSHDAAGVAAGSGHCYRLLQATRVP